MNALKMFSSVTEGDQLIPKELAIAEINILRVVPKDDFYLYPFEGQLRGWRFRRSEKFWSAETPRFGGKEIPAESAFQFAAVWKGEVGHLQINDGDGHPAVRGILVYSQESLTAFAHLIKAFTKK